MRNDEAFANAKYIPGGVEYPPRWAARAEAFRQSLGDRALLRQPYGKDPRNWFNFFGPQDLPVGTVIFVHGGYWLETGPDDYSHLAAGALARGWAVAMPAYTLAPGKHIAGMTEEIAAALPVIAAKAAGPIVVTGHSAGGHLTARMAQISHAPEIAARLQGFVPISPISDLRPLMETAMAADLRLDLAEARAESPALGMRRAGTRVHVWVGGAERPAFLDQARRLGNAWACPVTVEAGRHHFDVIEGLEVADSPLMQVLIGPQGG
jgi:acetyl esterase/lipase